jgi:hypothetical protein
VLVGEQPEREEVIMVVVRLGLREELVHDLGVRGPSPEDVSGSGDAADESRPRFGLGVSVERPEQAVVGMWVDDAWKDVLLGGVDDRLAVKRFRTRDSADRSVVDADISLEDALIGADDSAVGHDEVVHDHSSIGR